MTSSQMITNEWRGLLQVATQGDTHLHWTAVWVTRHTVLTLSNAAQMMMFTNTVMVLYLGQF